MKMQRGRSPFGGSSGFTLIEVMITVAIVAVLSLLASVGYARWVRTSKTGEATSMLGAIRSGEETYRGEKLTYLPISTGTAGGTSVTTFYPSNTPTDQKAAWNPGGCSSAICTDFLRLNISTDGYVYYVYGGLAGPADGAAHSFTDIDGISLSYPAANDPWYYLSAHGNLNNDAVLSAYVVSSFNTNLIVMNSDE